MAYPIDPVVEHYGGSVPHRGGMYVKVRCPFHGDRTPSASVNTHKQRFHCFTCNFDGDAIAVIRWQEGCSYADAVAKAEEITGTGDSKVRGDADSSPWVSGNQGNRAGRRSEVETWRMF